MLILDSIETKDDVEYWKQELNKTSQTQTEGGNGNGNGNGEEYFSCTLDYHFSSIFNDDVDKDNDSDELLNSNNDNDNDQVDIEMKAPSSEEMRTAQRQLVLRDSLLSHFRAIKDKTNHTNLFYKTVKILTDKILEELDNWN